MSPEALCHLRRVDPVMGRLIREIGECALAPAGRDPPFAWLVRAVAHQQLTGTAANTILRRFVALFPGRRFPRPADLASVSDDQLRAAGFSRAKVAAIRDIGAKVLDGGIPSARRMATMSDEEIVARLTGARGVGRWTVEMLLIFRLRRPDVLPVDDFGVRNGFRHAYGLAELPSPGHVRLHGEHWRPFRTTASWYLWRAADRARGRV